MVVRVKVMRVKVVRVKVVRVKVMRVKVVRVKAVRVKVVRVKLVRVKVVRGEVVRVKVCLQPPPSSPLSVLPSWPAPASFCRSGVRGLGWRHLLQQLGETRGRPPLFSHPSPTPIWQETPPSCSASMPCIGCVRLVERESRCWCGWGVQAYCCWLDPLSQPQPTWPREGGGAYCQPSLPLLIPPPGGLGVGEGGRVQGGRAPDEVFSRPTLTVH
jgi:hypothetical protein